MKYPALHKVYKFDDSIIGRDRTIIASVIDYWAWAHSDLLDNAERGAFAEYLVARAVGDRSTHRTNWEKYDITSSEGIHIEVKTSAYLQSWGQDKLSIIKFGIGKTYGYNYEINSYESEKKRQADVYVFCVLTETDQEQLNPLDTAQWDFYVLAAKVFDENPYYSDKESITLLPLINLGAVKCSFEHLHQEVINAMNKTAGEALL